MLIKMSKKQFMANSSVVVGVILIVAFLIDINWKDKLYIEEHKHLLCALVVCLLIFAGLVTARSAWRGELLLGRC